MCHGTSVNYYMKWFCPSTFMWVPKIEFRSSSLFNITPLPAKPSHKPRVFLYKLSQTQTPPVFTSQGMGSQKHMTTVNPSKFYILSKYCLFKIMGQGNRDPYWVSGLLQNAWGKGHTNIGLWYPQGHKVLESMNVWWGLPHQPSGGQGGDVLHCHLPIIVHNVWYEVWTLGCRSLNL